MAIVIKEIYVKTTVEQRTKQPDVTEETIQQLKRAILKELQEQNRKQTNWEKER